MKLQPWITMAVICMATTQLGGLAVGNSSSKVYHKIDSLPGQPPVNFRQYAGYITIDEGQQRALFYYFVEAETDPALKPLVLWLNGGPGCSSLVGAFVEHGPFKPSGGGTLVKNSYSWNKEANMLYLESPAGVGFSYSKNTSFYESLDDTVTAQDNLVFLHNWLAEFPEYKERDLYITGESYAGHYVPQLAMLIILSGSKFNLKGIAMGNPLLEFDTDFGSRGLFLWSHGLISDDAYNLAISTCNISQLLRESIAQSNLSAACSRVSDLLSAEISPSIDFGDVTADICVTSGESKVGFSQNHQLKSIFQLLHSLRSAQESFTQSATPKTTPDVDPCIDGKVVEYLNKKDVQDALHARLVGVANWTICGGGLEYYDVENLLTPTIDIVGSLVRSGFRVVVYSGDQDVKIPFVGSRALIRGLAKELKLNITVPYRAWFDEKQVGGWTEAYGDNLTYATIRGASHRAPYSSPGRSLAVFRAFLAGKPLPRGSI